MENQDLHVANQVPLAMNQVPPLVFQVHLGPFAHQIPPFMHHNLVMDPLNPYFVHLNESSGPLIATVVLDGQNYHP